MSRASAWKRVSTQVAMALAITGGTSIPALGASVTDNWALIAVPPAPPIDDATVDGMNTALLVLDLNTDTCTPAKRPGCARSLPAVQRLLGAARVHGLLIVHTTGPAVGDATPPPAARGIDRKASEPLIRSYPDKFLGSGLDKLLAERGIATVIVVGVSANGAVLYTASEAAMRGFNVVVPLDGYSAETPFAELLTAWQLKNTPPSIAQKVTLTLTDRIRFR